jgi:RimJ/RimL family protein N-acetyltransferase
MFYGRLPKTSEQIKEMFHSYEKEGNNEVFIIVKKEENIAIGFGGIFEIDKRSKTGEIRILIGENKFWNYGFGMEVCAILTYYGFRELDLNMVYLGTSRSDNKGAIRFFQFLGFKLQGIKRQVLYRNGRYYDGTMMDFLKKEFTPSILKHYEKTYQIK